jgi:hypothetical protein
MVTITEEEGSRYPSVFQRPPCRTTFLGRVGLRPLISGFGVPQI